MWLAQGGFVVDEAYVAVVKMAAELSIVEHLNTGGWG